MKEKIGYIIKMLRLPIVALAVVMQIVVHFCFFGTEAVKCDGVIQMPLFPFVMLLLASAFIVMGGFVCNDYFDTRIDKINRPLTRIVETEVSRGEAFNVYTGLCVAALVCVVVLCVVAWQLNYFFLFVGVIGLLWFYSASYKRRLVLGNLMFGLAVAMLPMMVVLFDCWYFGLAYRAIPAAEQIAGLIVRRGVCVSAAVFGWGVVLDVVRSMKEEKGERELECHSLPIVLGMKWAKVAGCVVFCLTTFGVCAMMHRGMAQIGGAGMNFVFLELAMAIAFCVQMRKSKTRVDYNILSGIVYGSLVVSLCYLLVYWYYVV